MSVGLRGCTAVIIDDSPEEGEHVRKLLVKRGAIVLARCENGIDGIAAIRKHRPKLAIVDQQMGQMFGQDVVIRGKPLSPDTIFVMCSATSQGAVRAKALAIGAAAFIGKPYDDVLAGEIIEDALAASESQT